MDANLMVQLDHDSSRAAELVTKLQDKKALPRGTEAMVRSFLKRGERGPTPRFTQGSSTGAGNLDPKPANLDTTLAPAPCAASV